MDLTLLRFFFLKRAYPGLFSILLIAPIKLPIGRFEPGTLELEATTASQPMPTTYVSKVVFSNSPQHASHSPKRIPQLIGEQW